MNANSYLKSVGNYFKDFFLKNRAVIPKPRCTREVAGDF